MWPTVTFVIIQTVLAIFSLYILSAVRAQVSADSAWMRGQKDAIFYLESYVDTGNEIYFREYRRSIAVPLADREARLEMDKRAPDFARVAALIVQGENHPNDVGRLIWLYRTFKSVPYVKDVINLWIASDGGLSELARLGDEIRKNIESDHATPEMKRSWATQLKGINFYIGNLSRTAAHILSEWSHLTIRLLLAANLLTATVLLAVGIYRTRRLFLQRIAFEAALNTEKERIATTLASIGQAVITVDGKARLSYMNPAAERLVGTRRTIARGFPVENFLRLKTPNAESDETAVVHELAKGAVGPQTGLSRTLHRNDGTCVSVAFTGTPLIVNGAATGAVIVLHDMTREQEYITKLSWQASHDELTNLANRREFELRSKEALHRLARTGTGFALLYLDLDQFKIVNDTCGHAAGDHLLRHVGAALQSRLSASDLLARLGGDEFGVLLPVADIKTAQAVAEDLRLIVEKTAFEWAGRGFRVTASIGLAYVNDRHTTLEDALCAADVACYTAKENGRNRVQLHTPSDSDLLRKFGEMAWVQRIRNAVDEDRLFLVQQEIRPLCRHAAPVGKHVEVLLRLRDESGRIVPPATFLPSAERYDLMPSIDRWVVRHALSTLARIGQGAINTCAINLSGATLGDETFIAFLKQQLHEHGVAPASICFEITETSAIANLADATRFIQTLKQMGCRFSLDDFGAGMSSFTYLKHLPVDYLKIDGAFIRDMLRDPIDRAMVETIDRIGKLMGKLTIAEFVESAEIADALREIGVDYAQGYGIARPAPFTPEAFADTPLARISA